MMCRIWRGRELSLPLFNDVCTALVPKCFEIPIYSGYIVFFVHISMVSWIPYVSTKKAPGVKSGAFLYISVQKMYLHLCNVLW